jgi:hypothetical protein
VSGTTFKLLKINLRIGFNVQKIRILFAVKFQHCMQLLNTRKKTKKITLHANSLNLFIYKYIQTIIQNNRCVLIILLFHYKARDHTKKAAPL